MDRNSWTYWPSQFCVEIIMKCNDAYVCGAHGSPLVIIYNTLSVESHPKREKIKTLKKEVCKVIVPR